MDIQSAALTKQGETLEEQMLLFSEKSKKVAELESKIDLLETAVQSLQTESNESQQYSRRNSIRIDNFKADLSLNESEMSKQVVSFFKWIGP